MRCSMLSKSISTGSGLRGPGRVETFTYYADGELETGADFNGRTATYAYDDAGRLITRTPDAFFASQTPVTFTYWPSGRRKTMSDSTGVTSYAYDSRGNVTLITRPQGIFGRQQA